MDQRIAQLRAMLRPKKRAVTEGGQAAPKAWESGQVGHRLTASPSFPDGLLVAGAASRRGRLPGAKFGTARWRRAGVYWPQAGTPKWKSVRRDKPARSRECKSLTRKGVATRWAPSFAPGAARCPAKRKQGYRWAGYRASKNCNQDADAVDLAEGNMTEGASASRRPVLRSRRPQTRLEASCTRTGRPRGCLSGK